MRELSKQVNRKLDDCKHLNRGLQFIKTELLQ